MRTVPDPRVHFVADAGLCESMGRAVRETVIAAAEGGATCMQLRVKDSDGRPSLEEVLEAAKTVDGKAPVTVDDHTDVFFTTRAFGAQITGVHVGRSDLPASLVRILIGESAYFSLSIGTQEETQVVREEEAVGHVGLSVPRTTAIETNTPDVLGFEGCGRLKKIVGIPAIAVGGVGVDDMTQLARIDTDKGAIAPVIYCAPDPAATAV